MSASVLPFLLPLGISSLAAPTNVTVTQLTDGSGRVRLDWTAAATATSYEILVDGGVRSTATGTTFTTPATQSAGTHTYSVRALNSYGASRWTDPAQTYIALFAPTSLASSLITDALGKSKVKLTWTATSDATAYDVQIDGFLGAGPIVGTTYTTPIQTAGTHTYAVRSNGTDYVAGGPLTPSAWSGTVSVAVPVSLPTNLAVTTTTDVLGKVRATLTWTASSDATSYDVQIDGVTVATGLSTTTYTTGILVAGVRAFTVRANDATLPPSGWTNPLYVTVIPSDLENRLYRSRQVEYVLDGLYCRISDRQHFRLLSVNGAKSLAILDDGSSTATEDLEVIGPQHIEHHAPAAPSTLEISYYNVLGNGTTDVGLTWTASPFATLGYQVYRSQDGVTYTPLGKVGGTTYTDFAAPNGAWHYKVTGINVTGEGPLSRRTTATTPSTNQPGTYPPAPKGVTAVQSSAADGRVLLTWQAAVGAAGYYPMVDGVLLTGSGSGTTFTSDPQTPGVHYYGIIAYTGTGIVSDQSTTVAVTVVTTPPPQVVGFTGVPSATGVGVSKVILTWVVSQGATLYDLYRSSSPTTGFVKIATVTDPPTYTHTGVTNGTWYYRVIPTNAAGYAAAYTQITVVTSA